MRVSSDRFPSRRLSCLQASNSYLESETSTWEPEMEDLTVPSMFYVRVAEIIPPEREDRAREDTSPCLCCGRRSRMDEDGCGICEECLAP
jgi:hypothetical protein